jgi:hypothetical protein
MNLFKVPRVNSVRDQSGVDFDRAKCCAPKFLFFITQFRFFRTPDASLLSPYSAYSLSALCALSDVSNQLPAWLCASVGL